MNTTAEIIKRAEACGAIVKWCDGVFGARWQSVSFPGRFTSSDLHPGKDNTYAINNIASTCEKIERERELCYKKPGVGDLMREVAKELAERIEQANRDAAARLTLHGEGDVICNGQHYGPVIEINVSYKDELPSIQYVFLGEDGNEHKVIYYNAMPYNNQP